jgi:hypothetical protein
MGLKVLKNSRPAARTAGRTGSRPEDLTLCADDLGDHGIEIVPRHLVTWCLAG